MSENTVRKCVMGLKERGLIVTEPTSIRTRDGQKRNGSLLYIIRPIQEALNQFYERQMAQAEMAAAKQMAAGRLCEPLCGALENETSLCPSEGGADEMGRFWTRNEGRKKKRDNRLPA